MPEQTKLSFYVTDQFQYHTLSRAILDKYQSINHAAVWGVLITQFRISRTIYIYKTERSISEELHMSLSTVKRVMKDFKSDNLLHVVKKGVPAKNWYAIVNSSIIPIENSFRSRLSSGLTQSPLVGSHRAVSNKEEKQPKENVSTKHNGSAVKVSSSKKKKPSIFKAKTTKHLLDYWIDLGLRTPSKESTKQKALLAISNALRHNNKKQIENSFDTYAHLLECRYVNSRRIPSKLSVDDFLNPTGYTKKQMQKDPDMKEYSSMFALCLEGNEHAENIFSTVKKAKNKGVSKLVQKYVADKADIVEFNNKHMSIMNGLANNLEEFWQNNHKKFMGYTMRNTSRRPGSIVKIYFEFLEDSGIFSDQFQFHWINSRQRIDDFEDWLIYHERLKRTRRANAKVTRSANRQHDRKRHPDRNDNQQRSNATGTAIRLSRHV